MGKIKNFYPPEGHDFVNTSDIRREAAHNQALLEACYLGDVAMFRMHAWMKLRKHQAIGRASRGWAIFHPSSSESQTTTIDPMEVLVMSYSHAATPAVDGHKLPTIRIVTNELVNSSADELTWLTEDVTVDHEGDAQYMVDSVTMTPEGEADFSSTLSPIFTVAGDRIMLSSNFAVTTPLFEVGLPGERYESVHPLGHYSCLEDKIHALGVANVLLGKVTSVEPTYSQTS